MMVMMSVLESALTVSPTAMSTETTVPLMGLFRVASASDCSALMRSALAESMEAWSDAICSGVSLSPPVAPDPVAPVPVPSRRRVLVAVRTLAVPSLAVPRWPGRRRSHRRWSHGGVAALGGGRTWSCGRGATARGLGVEGLAECGLVLRHGGLILRHLLLVRRDRLECGLARRLAGWGAGVGAGAVFLGLGQVGRFLVLVGRGSTRPWSARSGPRDGGVLAARRATYRRGRRRGGGRGGRGRGRTSWRQKPRRSWSGSPRPR